MPRLSQLIPSVLSSSNSPPPVIIDRSTWTFWFWGVHCCEHEWREIAIAKMEQSGRLRACVASTNPVKVGAVQQALAACFPDRAVEVEGCSVPSGVADQPMSDAETKRGAMNRFPVSLAYDIAC